MFTTPDHNPWFAVAAPMLAQRGHLAPPEQCALGVFALGQADRVSARLTGAGFSEPAIEPIDFVFQRRRRRRLANDRDLNGPLAVIIAELPEDERDASGHAR